MTLRDTTAANIRGFRMARGLTQFDLAQRAGITVSYVSLIERRRRSPPLETLEAIGEALQVQPFRFLKPGGGEYPAGQRRTAARRGRR